MVQQKSLHEWIPIGVPLLRDFLRPPLWKGFAVRRGILASHGSIVLFIDSGSCVSYADVSRGLTMIRQGICDIAQASRYHPESSIVTAQKPVRQIVSKGFENSPESCSGFRAASRLAMRTEKFIAETWLVSFSGNAAAAIFVLI